MTFFPISCSLTCDTVEPPVHCELTAREEETRTGSWSLRGHRLNDFYQSCARPRHVPVVGGCRGHAAARLVADPHLEMLCGTSRNYKCVYGVMEAWYVYIAGRILQYLQLNQERWLWCHLIA